MHSSGASYSTRSTIADNSAPTCVPWAERSLRSTDPLLTIQGSKTLRSERLSGIDPIRVQGNGPIQSTKGGPVAAAEKRMAGGSRALEGLRIPVVDDNEDALDALSLVLAINGADVRRCRNASAARKLLQSWRSDLVISDLTMPGEDGFELILSIRGLAAEEGGRTKAIAYSATADPLARRRALECGFQEFVPKIKVDELLRTIALVMAGGRG